ncbi:MAG TPA: PIG-L deacetylase family protein, partial [Dissulfurispiraceae bacterium]
AGAGMMRFALPKEKGQGLTLLCLGAHSDDIEIGCGGTVLRLVEEYAPVSVIWVVFSSSEERTREALESAHLFLANATKKEIIIKGFRDGFLPYSGAEVKECFEALRRNISPDLILTHCRHDLHQDHRLVSELTWNTFRDHLIVEYEIIKYDGDFGAPNLFVHLEESVCRRKIDYIMQCFQTQQGKNWFTEDVFFSVLRMRGLESKSPGKYAEGYYCRKLVC